MLVVGSPRGIGGACIPGSSCTGKLGSRKSIPQYVLTGGSLVTDGRVTQIFRKEKMRSNNSNDGNYLLLWGILSKLMSSNVL
jgi:hypothetical protein